MLLGRRQNEKVWLTDERTGEVLGFVMVGEIRTRRHVQLAFEFMPHIRISRDQPTAAKEELK